MQLSCRINSPIIKMFHNVKQRPERNLQKVFCLIFRVRSSTTFVLLTIYLQYELLWIWALQAGNITNWMLFNSILAAPLFQANQNTRQQTAKRLDKHSAWGVLIFHKLYFQNLLCSEPFLEAGLNSDDVQFSWDW